MTNHHEEPERLMHANDALLRQLVLAGQDELGDAEQLAKVAAKLGPIVASAASAHAGGVATAKAASGFVGSALAKILGILSVGTALTVAAVYVAKPSKANAPAREIEGVSSSSSRPIPVETAVPTETVVTPGDAAPTVAKSLQDPVLAPRSAAPVPQSSASTSPEAVNPESEVKVLQRAQSALRSDPARALTICEEHRQRFPGGPLSQEREVIAIEALVRVGRKGEAESRANQFATAHPSSTHLRRIEVLLGKAPR